VIGNGRCFIVSRGYGFFRALRVWISHGLSVLTPPISRGSPLCRGND
jgi:hypothetical protein